MTGLLFEFELFVVLLICYCIFEVILVEFVVKFNYLDPAKSI